MIVLVILIACLVSGCVSPRAIRKDFEPYLLCPGGDHHIFIAAEDTAWKHDVVAALAADLGEEYCVSVDNLAALGRVSIKEWDVIVVLSTIYALGLQSDTAAFLKRAERKDRVVLLVTSSITDLKGYGVDAVSAASTGDVGEDARSLTPKRQPSDVAIDLARLIREKTE